MVQEQIRQATRALHGADVAAAREVIAQDRAINGMRVQVDEDTINLIALRQPLASDLRLIMSLANTATDLERIGDGAKKIARMTLKIYEGACSPPRSGQLRDVAPMAELALTLLRDSLAALAGLAVEQALGIIRRDQELDEEFQCALRRQVTYMMEDPRSIGIGFNVIFVIKALERIGDHCKNIAEHTVHLVEGKNIRERGNLDRDSRAPPSGDQ